jgi:membrane fusion protein, multidrug efflux system
LRHGLLLFVCGLVFLLACTACGQNGEKAAKSDRAAPVMVAPATSRTVSVMVKGVGNVEPMATVAVKPQVGGAIVDQFVRDGADVAKNEPLFRIDPRPYELAIREAQARLDRDKALLVKAEGDLKRYATLKSKDVVAQEQYDQTFSQSQTLEGTIRLDQASLERSRLDLEYATIRAPIAGRVGSVLLTAGNVLKANDDRVMCVINQINPIFIAFSVPERYLPAIQERQRQGAVAVTAAPDGEQGKPPVTATLAAVDNTVDAKTGAIRLKAVYDNADHRLWPGQFVRVDLTLAIRENAVLIPTQAVLDGLHGPYVYVIGPDDLAEVRQITPGPIIEAQTVVDKGITPGERVVVDGQVRLAPGAKAAIKPTDQADAKPASGAAQ